MAEVEVIVDQAQLLKVGQALTDLEARKFIKPALPPLAKTIIKVVSPYPKEGTRLKSRQRVRKERAQARAIGGSLLASFVSTQDEAGAPVQYKRTGTYGQQWAVSVHGDLEVGVKNDAAYAGYVGGLDASPDGKGGAKGNQPYTWRYGWQRLKKIMQDNLGPWISEMEHKAFKLWER